MFEMTIFYTQAAVVPLIWRDDIEHFKLSRRMCKAPINRHPAKKNEILRNLRLPIASVFPTTLWHWWAGCFSCLSGMFAWDFHSKIRIHSLSFYWVLPLFFWIAMETWFLLVTNYKSYIHRTYFFSIRFSRGSSLWRKIASYQLDLCWGDIEPFRDWKRIAFNRWRKS